MRRNCSSVRGMTRRCFLGPRRLQESAWRVSSSSSRRIQGRTLLLPALRHLLLHPAIWMLWLRMECIPRRNACASELQGKWRLLFHCTSGRPRSMKLLTHLFAGQNSVRGRRWLLRHDEYGTDGRPGGCLLCCEPGALWTHVSLRAWRVGSASALPAAPMLVLRCPAKMPPSKQTDQSPNGQLVPSFGPLDSQRG